MKSFLEEYGFAILAAIVVILLIAMCTPVGNLIRNQVMSVVESFAGRTESKLSAIDDSEVKVAVKTTSGNVHLMMITAKSETDVYEVQYRLEDKGWTKIADWTYDKTNKEWPNKDYTADDLGSLKNADKVDIRLLDTGHNNTVVFEQDNIEFIGA